MSLNEADVRNANKAADELSAKLEAVRHRNDFQAVRITLSDGRQGIFTGPVLTYKPGENVTVVQIDFSEPHPLPEGQHWGGEAEEGETNDARIRSGQG
jgi:hypothetical protein